MARREQEFAVDAEASRGSAGAVGGPSGGLRRGAERLATKAVLTAHRAWQRLKRTGVVRRALYSLENAAEFGKVYSHEVMLADRGRVDAYKAAIDRSVRPGDVVLDLGTGTGILAMMAAARGARHVHALDQTAVIELARHVAESNGIANLRFARGHSKDFDPGEKVDVILHEQIGDYLIDEDMIFNVCELRDRLLAPGGRILPARFEAFLEPVSLVAGRGAPLLWEQRLHGIDFGCARAWLEAHPEFETRTGRYMLPGQAEALLAAPEPAYRIDLERVAPDHVPGRLNLVREIVRPGVFAGFAHYFRIDLGEGIAIETGPFETERALSTSHWAPILFPVDPVALEPGDRLAVEWTVEEPTRPSAWTLRWRAERGAATIAAGENAMRLPWN